MIISKSRCECREKQIHFAPICDYEKYFGYASDGYASHSISIIAHIN